MSMDATVQIRIDRELKTQVENLYRSLGTSFAEAVRIFAQQSLREGGMPFRPTLKSWDELTSEEISDKLSRSAEDIAVGRVCTQGELDSRIRACFANGQEYDILQTDDLLKK